MMILLILITCVLENVLILYREVTCKSVQKVLRVKRLVLSLLNLFLPPLRTKISFKMLELMFKVKPN